MNRADGMQFWRRRVHIFLFAVFVGLPFLRIGGESALRFDLPTLRLHFFGAVIWMDEFFLVLLLALFTAFLFIWITLMYGRIWCGWMCPQVVLADLSAKGKGRGIGKRERHGASQGRALAVAVLTGTAVLWYFLSPYDFFRDLADGGPGRTVAAAWLSLTILAWLDIVLVRYTFCATVCPYSKLQGVMFDRNTLVIAYDGRRAEECIECGACVKACPVKIDIRNGLQASCVNCAECIDACAAVLERKGKSSLIGYFFGAPGGKSRPGRSAAVIAAAAAFAFFALLLCLLVVRSPVEVAVLPGEGFRAKRSSTGEVVATVVLSVTNRGREGALLSVTAEGGEGKVGISPAAIEIGPGERRRVNALLSAGESGRIAIILRKGGERAARAEAVIPDPD